MQIKSINSQDKKDLQGSEYGYQMKVFIFKINEKKSENLYQVTYYIQKIVMLRRT